MGGVDIGQMVGRGRASVGHCAAGSRGGLMADCYRAGQSQGDQRRASEAGPPAQKGRQERASEHAEILAPPRMGAGGRAGQVGKEPGCENV